MTATEITASALLPSIVAVVKRAQEGHNWGGIGKVRTTLPKLVDVLQRPQADVVRALTDYSQEFAVAINNHIPGENILAKAKVVGGEVEISVLRLTTDIAESFPYM